MKSFRRKRRTPFSNRYALRDVRLKKRLSFVRRHRDAITLYGALIVFATFVVKDGIRDFMKENVSGLDSAEILYYTRAQNVLMFSTLADVSMKTDAIYGTLPQNDFVRSNREGTDSVLHASRTLITQTKMLCDTVSKLFDKLPHPSGDMASGIAELKRRAESLSENEESLAQILEDPGTSDVRFKEALHGLSLQLLDARRLNSDLVPLSERVWKQFQTTKNEEMHVSEVSSWASYVLYTIGWSLALVGRLYGGGDVVEAE